MQFDKANDTFRSSPLDQNRNVGFESHDSAWVSKVGVNYRGSAFAAAGRPYAGPARFTGLYIGGNVGGVSYTALRHDADGYLSRQRRIHRHQDRRDRRRPDRLRLAVRQQGVRRRRRRQLGGCARDLAADRLLAPAFAHGDQSTSGKMGWFGTLRTRGGVAFNDVLVYGTGGIAVAGIDTTVSSTFVAHRPSSASSSARARPAGAGPAAWARNSPSPTTGA